jgi:hypothetical protein
VPRVIKSGSFKLLEPSWPVQGCPGIAVPYIVLLVEPDTSDSQLLYTSPSLVLVTETDVFFLRYELRARKWFSVLH